jgi:hypothetical protein
MPYSAAAAATHDWLPGRDTIDADFVADLLVGLDQIDPSWPTRP